MGLQAKITFTTLSNFIYPAKRVITLDSESGNVVIGRSSKSSSKDLHSSQDNAWFDSPVMSRNHAEISLDTELKSLILRDIGSMHGTSINNFQLVNHMPVELRNGDLVLFGTEVKRGSETYLPCKFIIHYEISSYETVNSFISPKITHLESNIGNGDYIQISTGDANQTQMNLTSDEEIINRIDFLDKNCQPEPVLSVINDCIQASSRDLEEIALVETSHKIQRSIGTTGNDRKRPDIIKSISKIVDSAASLKDKERKKITCDSSSQSTKDSDPLHHSDDMEITNASSEDNAEKKPAPWAYNQESQAQAKGARDNFISGKSNLSDYVTQRGHSSDIEIYNRNKCEPPSTNDLLNTKFSVELNFRRGSILLPCEYDHPRHDKQDRTKVEYASTNNKIVEINPQISKNSAEFIFSSISLDQRSLSQPEHEHSPANETFTFKTAKPQQDQNLRVGVYCTKKPEKPLDHILGQKTGKFAYFSAREFNKTKFRSIGYCMEETHDLCVSIRKQVQRQNSRFREELEFLKSQDDSKSLYFLTSFLLNDSRRDVPGRKGFPLTKMHLHEDLKGDICSSSDLPSVTTCKFSKELATTSVCASSTGPENHKSKQPNTIKPKKNKCRKRKADAMSDIWQVNGIAIHSSPSLEEPPSSISIQFGVKGNPSSDRSIVYDPRPTKKRKLLEILGYAAFGGLAAATGLFSILVATAPDFP
ncbi:putative fha domain protein [Golovinomyces cichoracearum]|uniref:Putative fha domain protein n=1 Tax=Golovinomyces cichoracearum TaxID=62708 RepID=A0A420IXN7_9PEZI|nr:putative fha domain protein [Golovinomyces cichoracearum]